MIRVGLLLVGLCSICSSQTSVSPPLIGVIRDSSGHMRRVFGTAGAFVIGPPEAAQAPGTRMASGEVTMSGRTIRLDNAALVIRTPDGQEKRVLLPGSKPGAAPGSAPVATRELQRMGDGWLWAAPFAIRLTADGAEIFRLPAVEVAR